MKVSAPKTVAVAGAAAIGASLIGLATPSQPSGPSMQARDVALTSGEADIFVPGSFSPTVAEGFPPFIEVLQGTGGWGAINLPEGTIVAMDGTDTQTTIGSFVNDDFLASSTFEENATAPAPGTEVDLANFGGGFENEYLNWLDYTGAHTITDTVITPFGNYTFPLGSVAPVAAVPADAFSSVLSEIQTTISVGEAYFPEAAEQFAGGNFVEGVNLDFAALNTFVYGVQEDLLQGGYAALTGGTFGGGASISPFDAIPLDYAGGLSQAQDYLSDAQLNFSGALTEFAGNHIAAGLDLFDTAGLDSGFAPEAIILGLVASLTGSG